TDFLQTWIQKAQQRAPSITLTLAQRWPVSGTPPNFRPGLTGYGWGINGSIMRGFRGPVGLLFRDVHLWFSDRGQDISNPPPSGQQFLAKASDVAWIELTYAGNAVQLQIQYKHAVAWNYNVTATSTQVDQPSQQLLF